MCCSWSSFRVRWPWTTFSTISSRRKWQKQTIHTSMEYVHFATLLNSSIYFPVCVFRLHDGKVVCTLDCESYHRQFKSTLRQKSGLKCRLSCTSSELGYYVYTVVVGKMRRRGRGLITALVCGGRERKVGNTYAWLPTIGAAVLVDFSMLSGVVTQW